MTSSREDILARVKHRIGDIDHSSARDRIKNPKAFTPTTAQFGDQDLEDVFYKNATNAYGTIERVTELREAREAIKSYLKGKDLSPEVIIPNEGELRGLEYEYGTNAQTKSGDACVLTGCFLAVAETGTIIAHSSTELSISSLYLADHHIVIVFPDQLVAGLEDIWPHLRGLAQKSNQGLPRSINWITGPSLSGDIEKQLTLGAHGPISLHIILVG